MDEQKLRFRVGVVVLAAAIIAIILITLLGAWPSPFTPRYTVQVEFPNAPGVTIDTPVRKSGIQIGRVAELELLENGRVLLTLKIDARYQLQTDEVCRISTGSLVTGDAVVEWIPAPEPPPGPPEPIEDQDYLTNGRVATDPFQTLANLEGKIDQALTSIRESSQSIGGAGEEVENVASRLNTLLGNKEEELEGLIDEALAGLQNFNQLMANLQEVTGDPGLQAELKKTLGDLPALFAEARATLQQIQATLGQYSNVAVRAERNLANLEDFTAPLGERGEEISQSLVDSIRSVNDLLSNLAELSRALNNEEGTIGQLVNNPELYNRANRTLKEIEEKVRELEPILNDLRVISDKIARDPAQMGVKGILDRRPFGGGTKFPTQYPSSQRSDRIIRK